MNVINIKEHEINNFYKKDILDFKTYPDFEIAEHFKKKRSNTCLDLSKIESKKLREEIKVYAKYIFTNNYTSDYACEIFFFIDFAFENQFETILDFSLEELDKRYIEFRNRKYTRHIHYFISSFYKQIVEANDTRTGFNRDIWTLSDFNIDPIRFNKATSINTLNFTSIKNIENREIVKLFLKYLIGNTAYSISVIMNNLSNLSAFCNDVEINLLDMTDSAFESYVNILNSKNISVNHFNGILGIVRSLYDYLIAHKKYDYINPVSEQYFKKEEHLNLVRSAISDYVIFQMFNHLHLLPFNLMLMYLINFSTGLRISDICQLDINCLFQTNDHYFIKHKVQKMKKEQINIVPISVGLLIKKQIREVKKANPKQSFLFPAIKDNSLPMRTEYYRKNMKQYVKEWGIKEEDGSDYDFRSHAYRHSIATSLINDYQVDLAVVQLGVLGHTQINMSLVYAERPESRKKHYQTEYIDNSGAVNSTLLSNDYSEHFDWFNANIETQILSNGLCTYPTKLGACPHYNACLTCKYFRTNIRYLDIHKDHLRQIESRIPVYEANGWVNNLETAKLQREHLLKIIAGLENIQKGDIDGSSKT